MADEPQSMHSGAAQVAPWSLQGLPITIRLPLFIGGLVVIVVAVVTAVSLWSAHRDARNELVRQGQAMLVVLAAAADDPLYLLDVETLREIMSGLGEPTESGVVFGQIYDHEGRLLADSTTGSVPASLEPDPVGREIITGSGLLRWEQDRLIIGQVIAVGGRSIGAAALGLSTAPVEARLREMIVQGLAIAAVAALVGAFLAQIVSRSTLRPIQELAAATARVSCGDFQQPVPVVGRDELARLGQSFNSMISQLGRLVARERDYQEQLRSLMHARADAVRTVVHDLNHMVQATQSALDLWMMEIERGGIAAGQLAIGRNRLQQTLDQQRDLLVDMRDSALMESGTLLLQREPTDLFALVNEAVAPLLPRFEVAECQLRIAEPPADLPPASCDPRRMRRVFYNILENALRYTSSVRDDGEVTVHLMAANEAVSCQISDNGRGIPPDKIAHLGRQFVRLASGEGLPEGMGLGLNFAMGIVQLNDGEVIITSRGEGQGTTVTIRLPLATSA